MNKAFIWRSHCQVAQDAFRDASVVVPHALAERVHTVATRIVRLSPVQSIHHRAKSFERCRAEWVFVLSEQFESGLDFDVDVVFHTGGRAREKAVAAISSMDGSGGFLARHASGRPC